MSLTDTEIRNITPSSKRKRYYDERGLYLEVAPSGGKWWRFKYRFAGKEKRLSLGVYPEVGLKADGASYLHTPCQRKMLLRFHRLEKWKVDV